MPIRSLWHDFWLVAGKLRDGRLVNHADGIASIEPFGVPTLSFRLLYGLLILGHSRRRILWLGATIHPSAEWIAQQLTENLRLGMDPKLITGGKR